MAHRYIYDGSWEFFPDPPIARFLEPGDVVESEVELTHARLRPAPVTSDKPKSPPKPDAIPAT